MEQETHQFQLINNTYSASAAKEVLTSLIRDKIRFLNVQVLSNHERFGADVSHAAKRVEQLQAELEEMNKKFEEAIAGDYEVEVSCPINITLRKPEAVTSE